MGAQRTVDQLSGFETFATSRGRTGCLYRIQLRQSRDVDCVFTLTSSFSTSVFRHTRGYFSVILTASCHSFWYFPDIGYLHLCSLTLIPCFSTRVPQGILMNSAISWGINIHIYWNTAQNVKYPLKYRGKFWLAMGNTGVISMRYQQPFCLCVCVWGAVVVFMGRDS